MTNIKEKIWVEYLVYVTYQKEPVVLCGHFTDMDHFKRFAELEVKRSVYKKIPFQVWKCGKILLDT